MQRFVYVPKVEVYLRTDGDPANPNRVVDLTEDLIDGSVERKLNEMSKVSFTLENKFGRYTGGAKGTGGKNAVRIRPMDRIIVRMSRVSEPFLTFSGYVDESPYFQLYPGPIHITASCTLKLIQNTYFDPGLPYLQKYFNQFGWSYNPSTGTFGGQDGQAKFGYLDVAGGVGDVITHALHDIGNWPLEAINIQKLPDGFLSSVSDAMNRQLTDLQKADNANFARIKKFLGTSTAPNSSTTNPTGAGSTNTTTNPQTGNISIDSVVQYAKAAGFTGVGLQTIVAIGRAESGFLTNNMGYNGQGSPVDDNSKSYDVGIWQINSGHTPGGGGTNLPAPPSGEFHPCKVPDDWNAIKSSVASGPQTFITNCQDPAFNAKQAFSLSNGGTTFTAWSTFNKGAHQAYMPDAKTAIDNQAGIASIVPAAPGATTVTDPVGTRHSKTNATNKTAQVATDIVKIAVAESQKGIHESGGQNQGPEILKYQQYVGLTPGPTAQWCAAFASWVYGQAGITKAKSAGVKVLETQGTITNDPKPADMIHWGDTHVGIVVGRTGNTISYVAGNQGDGVNAGSATIGQPDINQNGVTPTFIHFAGVGTAASDAATSIGGTTDAGAASTQADAVSTGLQAGFAILQTQSTNSTLSSLLTGERAIANDVSLLGWIGQIVASSGRSFMSKPNGEFFAFFPDYFNNYTHTPYFNINDIEIVDFTVYENDTDLTTHFFATGPIGHQGAELPTDLAYPAVASVEDEAFPLFINLMENNPIAGTTTQGAFDPYKFLRRYGARPQTKDFQDVVHPVLLWLLVWREFSLQWAKRYTANVETTFLPELFPGTVVGLGEQGGITMFVNSVTHTFSREGGFHTSAEMIAPSASTSSNWQGLPRSGGFGVPTVYSDYYQGPH